MATHRCIVWFRRDLRLADNPALCEALATADEVAPLFVLDPRLWDPAGEPRRAFLVGCLRELRRTLGGRLIVRHGDPARAVPALADELDATEVFSAADFGPYGRARDEGVAAVLADRERSLRLVGSPYVLDPGTVVKDDGTPYRVFTPFSKAWRALAEERSALDPVPPPDHPLPLVTGVADDEGGIPEAPATGAELPEPGEEAAQRRLDEFLRSGVRHYDRERNRPDLDATSRLSPYLRWGCLHPRQALAALDRRSKGARVFESEICWREFYADVLHHSPASARQAWRPEWRDFRVDEGPETSDTFRAWAEGRTGYPIVDAGMRQLLTEGWMHNRVRMITASFLVKDLHLDWGRGARWFMAHLVDGDLASNNHGWQWVAGCGTDAAPYFRIFNPVSQGRRFDPEGEFVRRYVPELADLPADEIHEPWARPEGTPAAYPEPIVEHGAEREEALARYEELRRDV